MTKKADIGSKKLISLSPNEWVRWVTGIPNLETLEIISSDFQWVSREGDVLVKVTSPETGEFLILNEVQLRHDQNIPRRVRAYSGLAEEKYKCPIYPIVVNILPPSETTNIAPKYETNFLGIVARQDYKIINLWEVNVNIVFEQKINSLLPFVPVLKGGENEEIIREALNILRKDPQLNQLENLLAFFATFVLKSELVQQIMRWDMAVLHESPWYQEILTKGISLGKQEGISLGKQEGISLGKQEGISLGKKEGILISIQVLLDLKFGEEGLKLLAEIKQINDLKLLTEIPLKIKEAKSPEDFRQSYLNLIENNLN